MDLVEQHPAAEVWAEDRMVGRVTAGDAHAIRERMRGRETGLLVNRGFLDGSAQHVTRGLS